ncbi:hypothetical protein JN531_011260 [Flagellatimonas centrodinii]|uniref:hypothetical protein n=1 Tax=Flagellatimonas centrodinii TaxID=2806210 RepID=UPI001FEE10BA|nr:hypothetical protein [Flagellatimonas centrodinii]ULQ45688.1 hypothetical protein JN531_011260 [Flagellatimonas centrodinii]
MNRTLSALAAGLILSLSAGAALAQGGALSAEQRAQIEARCAENPERCEKMKARLDAARERCAADPARCEEVKAERREKWADRKAACEADPAACEARKAELRQKRDKMKAACDADPAACEARKAELREKWEARQAQQP